MRFFSWQQNQTTIHASRRRLRPLTPRFRPQLEALDERWLPSTLTVTSNLGFGAGSLRDEIAAAHSGDTIVFDQSLRGQTISVWSNPPFSGGGSYEIVIDKSLAIEGPGAGKLAISGGFASRVFRVTAGAQVTLSGMTIENGDATTGAYDPSLDDGYGGGIINYGTLTVNGCMVTSNTAAYFGRGGGIYNAGTLTVSGSTLTQNSASYYGGGIYNAGTLTVVNSTVIDNSAADGADVFTDHLFTKQNSKIGKLAKF